MILKHLTPPVHHKVQSHSTCGRLLTMQPTVHTGNGRKGRKKERIEEEEEEKRRKRRRKRKNSKRKRKEKRKKEGKGINEERYMSMHDNVALHLKINNVTLLLLSTGKKTAHCKHQGLHH